MSKNELRAHLVAELRALSPQQRAAASSAICRSVRAHPAWPTARLVAAFLPLPSEPQIAELWGKGGPRALCFPRVRSDRVELIRLDDVAVLRRSNWKFESEEIASAPAVAVSEVDLFLVPGLGFTTTGWRLGRGGGFYDRLLARRHPASVALGICFACQLVDELPREPHDQNVDAVIFEARN